MCATCISDLNYQWYSFPRAIDFIASHILVDLVKHSGETSQRVMTRRFESFGDFCGKKRRLSQYAMTRIFRIRESFALWIKINDNKLTKSTFKKPQKHKLSTI
jgi:hypothetical protein